MAKFATQRSFRSIGKFYEGLPAYREAHNYEKDGISTKVIKHTNKSSPTGKTYTIYIGDKNV